MRKAGIVMNCFKCSLYCKMAVTNLKNNRQFDVPYILTGMVSAAMFYIMRAIQGNEGIDTMRGSATLGKAAFPGSSPDGQIMTELLGDKSVLYVIVADDSQLDQIRTGTAVQYHIGIETDGTQEERKAFASALTEMLRVCGEQLGFDTIMSTSRAEQKDIYMETNGGFLFLGLTNASLFVECLAATTAVFAVIYFVVFRLTSGSYYRVVYR